MFVRHAAVNERKDEEWPYRISKASWVKRIMAGQP
jgi:hypothetical protein